MVEKEEGRVPAPMFADPFHAFRTEIDKLAEGFFGRRPRLGLEGLGADGGGLMMPSIDLKEDDQALVLTAELPGMDDDDIELTVRNGMLTLQGEKRHAYEKKQDDVQLMERRYGTVRRSIRLPETVDAERISAAFDKGVLTVTMPKRPDAAPPTRRIEITH